MTSFLSDRKLGGFIKQALSTVESRIDKVLDIHDASTAQADDITLGTSMDGTIVYEKEEKKLQRHIPEPPRPHLSNMTDPISNNMTKSDLLDVQDDACQTDILTSEDHLLQEIQFLHEKIQEMELRREEYRVSTQQESAPLIEQITKLQHQLGMMAKQSDANEKGYLQLIQKIELEVGKSKERELQYISKLDMLNSLIQQQKADIGKYIEKEHYFYTQLEEEKGKTESSNKKLKETKKKLLFVENLHAQAQKELETKSKNSPADETKVEASSHTGTLSSESGDALSSPSQSQTPLPLEFTGFSVDAVDSPVLIQDRGKAWRGIGELGATHSMVQNYESQISALQAQLEHLVHCKEESAKDLIKTLKENDELKKENTAIKAMEADYNDLKTRYNTVLEMLGEKTEMVEELQADIKDMKDAYRQQISELIAQINKLSLQK